MVFDFNIIYIKRSTIPHVDALSRLRFQSENGEEHQNSKARIIQWVEADVLSHKTLSRETQQDPILSGILEHIRKNVWSNCTLVKRPIKEAQHKLIAERGIIFSAITIVQPQILRKDIIKSMQDDIHGGVTATQRRLRLQSWWLEYCKDALNVQRLKHLNKPKYTHGPKRGTMEKGPYGPCTYLRHWFIFDLRFLLRLAGRNKRWETAKLLLL